MARQVMKLIHDQENVTQITSQKKVFHFIDNNGKKIHKAKEEFFGENKIIVYPYSLSSRFGLTTPKISQLEFKGWKRIEDLPSDFKITRGYGYKGLRIKPLMVYLRRRFKRLKKLVFELNGKTVIKDEVIVFAWDDLQKILRGINKEKELASKGRKNLIEELLSDMTTKIKKPTRSISPGDIDSFISRYNSFKDISSRDVAALTTLLGNLPSSKISITTHFIETREKMDLVFLEDLIEEFGKLMNAKNDNEEKWQKYFAKNSWLLAHLFPYQVILRGEKAFVGGKTIENKEGRIVDFLFQTGFKDNFALLEIKTHLKPLLNNSVYRKPDVFSISDDLSGGINQCLDQKDNFIKEYGKVEKPLDPKTILVIGQKLLLDDNQARCFELLRANQKNVDIVTFDELLSKLNGLHEVLTTN